MSLFFRSISVMCASRDSVRSLMLGVEETGLLIDSIVSVFAVRCLCYDVIVVFSVTRCLSFFAASL
jgi:hypothetical protein